MENRKLIKIINYNINFITIRKGENMAYNSYKEDEQSVEKSKAQTLKRLFSYLLEYKWTIVFVLLLMGYCVAISLANPLIIEDAIDNYTSY